MENHFEHPDDQEARERGIDYYVDLLMAGEGPVWLRHEHEERTMSDWPGCYGPQIFRALREGGRDLCALAEDFVVRAAEDVVRENYDRIMLEAAAAAAEEMVDDDAYL